MEKNEKKEWPEKTSWKGVIALLQAPESDEKRQRLASLREIGDDVWSLREETPASVPLPFKQLASACPKIRSLNFNGQFVSDLSPLTELTALQELNLANTQVEDLTPLSQLTNLEFLYLNNTQVRNLTPLCQLTGLKVLFLNNTYVEDWTPLSQLIGLKTLSLQNTQVEDLMPLSQITGLRYLSLNNTQVEDLTPISQLTRLKILSLDNTQVHDLTSLSHLTRLERLYLNSTQVHDLTPLSQLTRMKYLSLNDTQVRDLSPLADMNQLHSLWINNLQLDQIPRCCVRSGLDLYLDGTVLLRQPKALFVLPTEEILSMYFDQQMKTVNEGKVIFLGESGVGKTHTILRIQNQGKKEEYDPDSTPGVKIRPFHCGNGVCVNFWDFGGQEIMQSMHQCFLTERTCYVVVVSNKDPNRAMLQAKKWLRTVAGFSGQVSVLLAVNQWNNVPEQRNIDVRELKDICPKLTDVVFYSAMDDSQEDFNFLTKKIVEQVDALDSVHLELPQSWADIWQELKNMPEDYISLREYRHICEKHGLAGEDEASESIRMWLLEWFNDMGVCFSYHKNAPKDAKSLWEYKVLRPDWLTNGIYRIVDNGHKCSSSGRLSKDDINALLNAEEYKAVDPAIKYQNETEQRYILEIMRKFNRSYPLDDCEFVPDVLSEKSPEHIVPRGYGNPLVYTLKLTYLPLNLLHRLMIAMWAWHDGVLWRRGIRLVDDSTALVIQADTEKSELRISLYRKETEHCFCALFHEVRSRLLRDCDAMKLRIEKETVTAMHRDSRAEYDLSALLERYTRNQATAEDHGRKIDFSFSMPNTSGSVYDFPLAELLSPFLEGTRWSIAQLSGSRLERYVLPMMNAEWAVYPYATKETVEKLPEREKKLLETSADFPILDYLVFPQGLHRGNPLACLIFLAAKDSSFLDWLWMNGVKRENIIRRTNPMLEQQRITGINRNLFEWAEYSELYKKHVNDPDLKLLAKALDPNENDRYKASMELLGVIWAEHPYLGLGPDYKMLAEMEHDRDFYERYRDHLTHMFKVFLLGLYLYEKSDVLRESIEKKYDQEAFVSVWILTALYHDIGYLVENKEGSRDGERTQKMIDRLNGRLACPLCLIYPTEFTDGEEPAFQEKANIHSNLLRSLTSLEGKLDAFQGLGASAQLSPDPTKNPIKAYYEYAALKRTNRTYYDHGIVSACILLYTQETLCAYINQYRQAGQPLFDAQRRQLDAFLAFAPKYSKYSHDAAFALALHNIQQDWNENEATELNQRGVAIGHFRIPLARDPIAYLLCLCDELQCWDRQGYDVPKEYAVGGDKLVFDTSMSPLSLSVFDSKVLNKLTKALENLFDPPILRAVLEIHG